MRPIFTCSDARRGARAKLPRMLFDYIDGAAGEGLAEKRNKNALRDLCLQTSVLQNVLKRSVSVNFLDKAFNLPFGVSPMGMCNLAWPGADLMLARLAAKQQIPLGISTAGSTKLETMIETAEGNAWFQLYFSGNEEQSNKLIDRAAASGYETLVLTVDVPEVGRRPRELRRGFTMPFKMGPKQVLDFALHPHWSISTLISGKPELANFGGDFGEFDRTASRAGADWSLLEKIRQRWTGKLVVKGVLNVADAIKLKDKGVDAIQVSSHGGRQFDSAPITIYALAAIREALGDDYPLIYDSGIRSGEDIIKAYALGANYVLLGRPFLFAIATGAERGLDQLVQVLKSECSIALAQLGLTDFNDISRDLLVQQDAL